MLEIAHIVLNSTAIVVYVIYVILLVCESSLLNCLVQIVLTVTEVEAEMWTNLRPEV